MRVLFYGGCHAQALRDIFRRYAPARHEFDQIKNFELIASGAPFPYDRLPGYDWVIYSPIFNKPNYSTETLRQFCGDHGIRALSFPWLQWQGYFPKSVNGVSPLGVTEWFYPALIDLARDCDSLPAFASRLFDRQDDPAALAETAREAAENLDYIAGRETLAAVDLPISGLVRATFAQRRLFLTPNHPSINLYRPLAARIAERLDVALDRALETTAWEPQAGVKTPILPGVHAGLELMFRDSDYQSNAVEGAGGGIDLADYLQRLFIASRAQAPQTRTGFTALSPTFLKGRVAVSDTLDDDEKIGVRRGDSLTFHGIEDHGGHIGLRGAQLNGRPVAQFQTVYIFRPHWRRQAAG